MNLVYKSKAENFLMRTNVLSNARKPVRRIIWPSLKVRSWAKKKSFLCDLQCLFVMADNPINVQTYIHRALSFGPHRSKNFLHATFPIVITIGMLGEFWVHLLLLTGKVNIGYEKENLKMIGSLNSSRIRNIFSQ